MPGTTTERYVVASCHVERPLDDDVWQAFSALQARRPGGITVAALMRPPDRAAGEVDGERWLNRAREASQLAPFGHHTHWTSPTHARPTAGDPGERVAREGDWLREHGLHPTLFCGGAWYADASVASACAALGYADCTPRASRPPYLDEADAWIELAAPAWIALRDGARLAALPTTHSVGDALRAALSRSAPERLHVYFHDTDLVDRRRRAVVLAALRLLGRRRARRTLADELLTLDDAPTVAWEDVVRGMAAEPR